MHAVGWGQMNRGPTGSPGPLPLLHVTVVFSTWHMRPAPFAAIGSPSFCLFDPFPLLLLPSTSTRSSPPRLEPRYHPEIPPSFAWIVVSSDLFCSLIFRAQSDPHLPPPPSPLQSNHFSADSFAVCMVECLLIGSLFVKKFGDWAESAAYSHTAINTADGFRIMYQHACACGS